jgi:hypothetical protein
MASIKVKVETWALFYDKKKLAAALRAAGGVIVSKIKSDIKAATKRGVASQPGQPPLSRTGALVAGLKSTPSRDGETVSITDSTYYSKFQEFGALGGGGRKGKRNNRRTGQKSTRRVLKPRPFIGPVIDEIAPTLGSKIEKAIDQGVSLRKVK